jgi:putative transposase
MDVWNRKEMMDRTGELARIIGERKTFLAKVAASMEVYNVNLIAYVCMTNHFHLLVNTPDGNLADFMRHFI